MSFQYFAYGSNMLSSRLITRCDSARAIGTAIAKNHTLAFAKKSIDGSGKATLIEHDATIHTPGVLFEIDKKQRDELDDAEGKGYDRVDGFKVETIQGTVTATTYLATNFVSDLAPYDWYLALIVAGALEHELGDEHAALLLAISHVPDENNDRKSRIEALQALANHGHHDHTSLLKR